MRRSVITILVLLIAWSSASAQSRQVEQIMVGPLDRTDVLERSHPQEASSRLPIIIFLHSLGALVKDHEP